MRRLCRPQGYLTQTHTQELPGRGGWERGEGAGGERRTESVNVLQIGQLGGTPLFRKSAADNLPPPPLTAPPLSSPHLHSPHLTLPPLTSPFLPSPRVHRAARGWVHVSVVVRRRYSSAPQIRCHLRIPSPHTHACTGKNNDERGWRGERDRGALERALAVVYEQGGTCVQV